MVTKKPYPDRDKKSGSADKSMSSTAMTFTFTSESVRQYITRLVREEIRKARGGGSVKSRLRTAARVLGLTVDRVRHYHYDDVRRIEAHEAFQIIDAHQRAEIGRRTMLLRAAERELERQRREVAAEAPKGLAWMVPGSLHPMDDPAAESPRDDAIEEDDFT